jgi:beta-glucanase (GH16 family)
MQGYPYTSGIITTQETFAQQYGLFTIRVKLPKGQGFWPAFWMLPVKPDYPTEIDVFEMLGGDSTKIYMSNHWKDATGENQKSTISFQGPDFSAGFHTFSLLWSPNLLIWYVDGVEQNRTDQGVPNQPMFLLVNLAVGGQWPGNPDQTTVFPNSMQIDYIRVFKYLCNFNLPFVNGLSGFFDNGELIRATTPGKYHN